MPPPTPLSDASCAATTRFRGGRRPFEFVRKYYSYDKTTNKSRCIIRGCNTIMSGQHATNLQKHISRNHPVQFGVITQERMKLELESRQRQLRPEHASTLSTDGEDDDDDIADDNNCDDTREEALPRSSSSTSVSDITSATTSATASATSVTTSRYLPSTAAAYRGKSKRTRKSGATGSIKKKTIKIEMDKAQLFNALVELTTVNGRPLSLVDDSGMKLLLDPIVKALRTDGRHFNVNRYNVREHIQAEAKKMRENIQLDLKQRMVCLKFDTATRLGRSILGLNVQFALNGRLVLRSLCVLELHTRHTGLNLMAEIVEVLGTYGITLRQVYSCTTDNARNMTTAISCLSERAEKEASERVPSHDSDKESLESDNESMLIDDGDDGDDSQAVDFARAEERMESSWPRALTELPAAVEASSEGVLGQRCAAHTLQLAVCDGLAASGDAVTLIDAGRRLVKKLRTPTAVGYINTEGCLKPVIDVETRWNLTLEMLESLLKVRNITSKVLANANIEKKRGPRDDLSEAEWSGIVDVTAALIPAKVASMKFQAEQLVVGDFMAAWLRCKLETKAVGSRLALNIYQAMEVRESSLFDSQAIASAMYMDPRFNLLLSLDHKNRAEDHLVGLWTRLKRVTDDEAPGTSSSSHDHDQQQEGTWRGERHEDDTDDPLEHLLRRREAELIAETPRTRGSDVRKLLQEFGKSQQRVRLPTNTDVLLYWEGRKDTDQELYELAMVVLSLPVTQVSVERMFSHLKFILGDLRSKLHHQLVDDILVVRCNRLFRRVKQRV